MSYYSWKAQTKLTDCEYNTNEYLMNKGPNTIQYKWISNKWGLIATIGYIWQMSITASLAFFFHFRGPLLGKDILAQDTLALGVGGSANCVGDWIFFFVMKTCQRPCL